MGGQHQKKISQSVAGTAGAGAGDGCSSMATSEGWAYDIAGLSASDWGTLRVIRFGREKKKRRWRLIEVTQNRTVPTSQSCWRKKASIERRRFVITCVVHVVHVTALCPFQPQAAPTKDAIAVLEAAEDVAVGVVVVVKAGFSICS